MIFAGIDPGVGKSAIAEGTAAMLHRVGFADCCNLQPLNNDGVCVLVEFPRIYPGTPSKDLNDLLDLAAIAGAWLDRNPGAVRVYPRDWKGQTKKPVHHLRLWQAASEHDRSVIAAAAGYTPENVEAYIRKAASAIALGTKVTYSRQAHNLLDAYGLYREAVKRFATKGER